MSGRRHRLRNAAAALPLLALAACSGGASAPPPTATPPDPPPLPGRKPVDGGLTGASGGSTITVRPLGTQSPPAPAAAAAAAGSSVPASGPGVPATYRVAAGDTLFAVSRRFNLPIQTIIRQNDLQPPYALRTGQVLSLPQQKIYQVEPGNTLYSISRTFDVDLTDLARANDLAAPYTVIAGQRLVIPSSGEAPPAQQVPPVAATAVPTRVAAAPAPAPADPAAPDAPPPGAATAATGAAAAATDGSLVVVGEPEKAAPPAPAAAAPAAAPSGPTTAPTSQAAVAAAPAVPETPTAVPQPPPRSGGRFLWPVQGKVISDYGPVGDGRHNDGINIAASEGTPVKAAENGVVVYAGNELRGFGNLLLIKHDNGWVTAYAHNSRLLVSRGDTVKRGQTIAEVGATGNVSTPQLHFEVRKGSRAMDPRDLLGS